MIRAAAILLVCHLLGELLAAWTGLPVPGPVIGLVLLLSLLIIRGRLDQDTERTADGLLSILALLFVPAGVGVIVHLDTIKADWLGILLALSVGTAATLAVTGLAFQALLKRGVE